MITVGVLLSGCGVYDGTEIHEAVFTLYELALRNITTMCIAPNAPQLQVVDHRTGNVVDEERNILTESARIARGAISSLSDIDPSALDALVLPGGFGTAKNHTNWAIRGADAEIREDVRELIRAMVRQSKPVVGLCMAPTTIAKALQGTEYHASVTVGTTEEPSPYDIAGISSGINTIGSHCYNASVREIVIDASNHIITAPCYMMQAGIVEVRENVAQAIDAMMTMIGSA